MDNLFSRLQEKSEKNIDSRGFIEILYEKNNITLKRSFSKKGVFRGMHIQQPPFQQTKLIRVIKGEIIDFLVNPNSTDKVIHWQKFDNSSDWILIDSNFAHGFYAITDVIFEYICDGKYNEESEQAFSITDFLKSTFGIAEPILSKKDLDAPPVTQK